MRSWNFFCGIRHISHVPRAKRIYTPRSLRNYPPFPPLACALVPIFILSLSSFHTLVIKSHYRNLSGPLSRHLIRRNRNNLLSFPATPVPSLYRLVFLKRVRERRREPLSRKAGGIFKFISSNSVEAAKTDVCSQNCNRCKK